MTTETHTVQECRPPMTVKTRAVQTLDLPLGPGRQTLRLILHRTEDGKPEALSLAFGFGGGDTGEPFDRPSWADRLLTLPADAIEPLREALGALDGLPPAETSKQAPEVGP